MFTLRDRVLHVDLARAILDPIPAESMSSGVSYDRYGVSLEHSVGSSDLLAPVTPRCKFDGVASDVERRRLRKWAHMFSHWEKYYGLCDDDGRITSCGIRHRDLQRRVLKGIPDGVRAEAWMRLLGSWDRVQRCETAMSRADGVFAADHPEASAYGAALRCPVSFDVQSAIGRDIRRTFRDFDILATRSGLVSLARVLLATASTVPRVGFVQSLSFLAAALLNNMTEVDAYHSFVALLQRHDIAQTYSSGLPGLYRHFWTLDRLIERHVPRFAKAAQADEDSPPTTSALWSTKFIMTLFFRDLPYALAVKIFDRFLIQGDVALYRALIALLQREFQGPVCNTQRQLLRCERHGQLPALDSPALRHVEEGQAVNQRLLTMAERVAPDTFQRLLEEIDALTAVTAEEVANLHEMWELGDTGRLMLERSAAEGLEAERAHRALAADTETVSRADELADLLSHGISFDYRDDLCGAVTDSDASVLTGHSYTGFFGNESPGDSGAMLYSVRRGSDADRLAAGGASERYQPSRLSQTSALVDTEDAPSELFSVTSAGDSQSALSPPAIVPLCTSTVHRTSTPIDTTSDENTSFMSCSMDQ